MSKVRVGGYTKGAFILYRGRQSASSGTSAARICGLELYHLKGSPVARTASMPPRPRMVRTVDPALRRMAAKTGTSPERCRWPPPSGPPKAPHKFVYGVSAETGSP